MIGKDYTFIDMPRLYRKKALSIIILTILALANSGIAANYRADLGAVRLSDSRLEVELGGQSLELQSISIDGKAVPFSRENRIYTTSLKQPAAEISAVSLYLEGPVGLEGNRPEIRIKSGDKGEIYDPPLILIDGLIINVTDSLRQAIVGAQDTHRVSFDLTNAPIGIKGQIWINFGTGFDVGGMAWAAYSDTDPDNDTLPPRIASIDVIAQTAIIRLDDGIPAESGRIALDFGLIHNDTVADEYHVTVMTLDSLENIVNGPVSSSPFTLNPGPPFRITVIPGSNVSVVSDSTLTFSASGYDQYNNSISNLSYTWGITVDSCGTITNGVFRSRKVGSCYVTASVTGLIDSSGLITIVPGAIRRFAISGTPSSRTAGTTFPSPVVVTAYDVNDNLKTNFTGLIYFTSTDSIATLPYTSVSPYSFQLSDSGRHSFSGSGFILRRSGTQTITVTDGVRSTTSPSITVQPGLINSFTLSANVNQTAGVPFSLDVTNAVDSWSNPANGSVTVSSAFGGGVSPNGVAPVLNNIIVSSGSGSASQTLTNATRTVLRGVGGSATVTTDTIRVLPGVVGRFRLSNYPSEIIAGQAFSTQSYNPRVVVNDIYGNVKINYTDSIYFSATDPQATVPNPYRFTSADSGIHSFSGDEFILKSAGGRRLIVSRGSLVDSSAIITVEAASINSFDLSAPVSATAGIAVQVTVSNAIDAYNNPASGVVVISDSGGAGVSPNGTAPIFANIYVNGGGGFAGQILTATGSARLKGVSGGSIVRGTDIIEVGPGILGGLTMSVASPQVAGSALVGPSVLTAYDIFGNLKTDFNSSADTIVIGSIPAGPMSNNVLRGSDDFTNGTADLASLNIIYRGQGGPIRFNATSQSGIVGLSNSVDVISLRASAITLANPQVARLDTAYGQTRFVNIGGTPVTITSIVIFESDGRQFTPAFTPPLPAEVPGGVDTAFSFAFEVPSDIAQGNHPLSFKLTGSYSGILTGDSLTTFTDTLVVLTASHLNYVSGTIDPDTLSTEGAYQIRFVIANSGGARINIADSSYVIFSDGSRTIRTALAESYYIDAGSQVNLTFDSITVPGAFTPGNYSPIFHYYGTELNGQAVDSVIIGDNLRIQTKPSIQLISGTMSPDTIMTGAPVRFTVRARNIGQAALQLNQNATRVYISDGTRQYVATLDTSSSVRIDRIMTGDTTLTFNVSTVPELFAPGIFAANINIQGYHNLQNYQVSLDGDLITVLTPGRIRLDSLYVVSPNAPKLNVSQPFRIHGFISNLGVEPVDSIKVRLISDGNSVFSETTLVTTLAGLTGTPFEYNITAAAAPVPSEIFHSVLVSATNRISGQPALIAPPLDNSAAIVIEEPTALTIDTIYVSDESLSTRQLFRVFARVGRSGNSDYSGPNKVALDFSGDAEFIFADSSGRDFSVGQLLTWIVTAPASVRTGRQVNVRFSGQYIDLNDSSTALGADSVAFTNVVVTSQATITHHAVILSPEGARDGVLSTGQTFVVTDTIRSAGNAGTSYGRLTVPDGYSCLDPVVQSLIGPAVTWRMAAPQTIGNDSLKFDCWTFDTNTGDSAFAGSQWIHLRTETKAAITLGAEIVSPPSAMDRIIEPGGYFVVRAITDNLGQAQVGNGQLSLLFGDSRFTAEEALVRDFHAGDSIEWTVHTVDEQILEGTQVAVVISSLPQDLNANAPAAVVVDTSGFTVILKNELPHLVFRDGVSLGGAAVKGQSLEIYRFNLHNSIDLANNQVALISFAYRIYSGNGIINPAGLISSSVLEIDGRTYNGVLSDSNIVFALNQSGPADIIIEPDSTIEARLSVVLVAQPVVNQFRIGFNSKDLTARVMIGGVLEQFVQVVFPDGADFTVASKTLSVVNSDFLTSVGLNQNPFIAANGDLEIGYNLAGAANLEFSIYNIEGVRIWHKQIAAEAGGHYGAEAMTWDGRTDSGERALSGVYYLFISNLDSGQKTKIKLALIW
jgi:hypothetical protein